MRLQVHRTNIGYNLSFHSPASSYGSLVPRLFILQVVKAVWRPGNEATSMVLTSCTLATEVQSVMKTDIVGITHYSADDFIPYSSKLQHCRMQERRTHAMKVTSGNTKTDRKECTSMVCTIFSRRECSHKFIP